MTEETKVARFDDMAPSYSTRLHGKQDTAASRLLNQSFEEIDKTPQQVIDENPISQKQQKSTILGIMTDVVRGIGEVPTQVLGGARDAAQEILDTTHSMGQWVEENIVSLGTIDQPRIPFVSPGGEPEEITLPEVSEPATVTGELTRSITQFMTGFVPAFRAMKAVGVPTTLGKSLSAGAIADMAVFDAHEARLSDLVESNPALSNPITEYLKSDPTDSIAEGKFKNAIEGLALGGVTDGFLRAVKGIKATRNAKGLQDSPIVEPEIKLPEIGDPKLPMVSEAKAEGYLAIKGKTKGKSININLARLNTSDDIKEAIDKTSQLFAEGVNESRRGKISVKETQRLADKLNLTPEQLLKRRNGAAPTAEFALASREMLASSADNLTKLAKAASDPNAGQIDMFKFRRALSVHAGIQAEVSGLTAEAGRALRSFQIPAGTNKMKVKQIRALIDQTGGMEVTKDIADKLSKLDPEDMAQFVEKASKASTSDMVLEAWINSLLSGPQTHVVNMIGNSMTALWNMPERFVAAQIGKLSGGGGVQQGEVLAQMYGLVEGTKKGLRLGFHTLKTGVPTDPKTKLEARRHTAIAAENVKGTWFGKGINKVTNNSLEEGGMAARAVDLMGEGIRLPGRALMSEDEFFKSVGYQMELHAQAYRKAVAEGLSGEDLGRAVADTIRNPPEDIVLSAMDAAAYNTFTKDLGKAGKWLQKIANHQPAVKVILPFIRTPLNIIKYAGERTPLAPLSQNVRAEIAAGGARRDMALAKISLGSMATATFAEMSSNGIITGGGPLNNDLRKTAMRAGWQPYSLKLGDTYYAYNRLDPVGILMGVSADFTEISGEAETSELDDIAAGMIVSISNNMVNKTYLQGLSNVLAAVTQVSPQMGAKKAEQFIKSLGGTVIPAFVSQAERVVDPTLRHTDGVIQQIKSRIPGYSKDLLPRRNLWGEPILLGGGVSPDMMSAIYKYVSPIYTSEEKDSPIDTELLRLGMPVSMPSKHAFDVELTDNEYSRLVELTGKEAKDPGTGLNLKEALEELIKTEQYISESDGPEGGKSVLIKSYVDAFRELGKSLLYDETEELRDRFQQKQVETAKALEPIR